MSSGTEEERERLEIQRVRVEIEHIRAQIDQSLAETARTRQLVKWQPWAVALAFLGALAAVLRFAPPA